MAQSTERFTQFDHVIQSEEEILAVIGQPKPAVLAKVTDRIDDLARAFIAKCPFLLIASSGADGHCDVSPKGDPAGFVKVLDEKHIAIPDRLGNRRIDTFRNVLSNPKVSLIFLVPGKTETLRIGGEARIVRDEELRDSMAVSKRAPDFAMVVFVERLFMHCPKCMLRSRLWKPNEWPDATGTPSLAETIVQYGKIDMTVEQAQTLLDQDAKERLY